MYKKLIQDIVDGGYIVTIIIDMSYSSEYEIDMLKCIIKDIKKIKTVIINNGNNKQYYIKEKFNYMQKINTKFDYNFCNILILKNDFFLPRQLINESGFILRLEFNKINIDKCRTLIPTDCIDIKKLLRKQKIKKLNK